MKNQVVVVVNPVSGAGLAKKIEAAMANAISQSSVVLRALAARLNAQDPSLWQTVHTTLDHLWSDELARALDAAPVCAVVAVGGDGTLMQVAQFLYRRKLKNGAAPALVAIPGGRGNDFVRGATGYSSDQGDFWNWIAKKRTDGTGREWQERPLDLITVGDRHFMNMASIGYGGRVVKNAHERKAFWSKTAAVYQVEGGLALFGEPKLTCEVKNGDAVLYSGSFFGAFVGNGPVNGSGLFWMPQAVAGDGKLDTIIFAKPNLLQMASTLSAIKKKKDPTFEHVRAQASELVFRYSEPVDLEVDGDYIGAALEHRFRCVPGALKVWIAR